MPPREPERPANWLWVQNEEWAAAAERALADVDPVPVAHRMPTRARLLQEGPEALLRGYVPELPPIEPDTRVVAYGSCFATRFAEWLADNGFNRAFESDAEETIVRNPLESPVVVAQQFRWAFGELETSDVLWQDAERNLWEATEERRETLRRVLQRADVLIMTLGIAETWYDRETREALWRMASREAIRSRRYEMRTTSNSETVAALETIDRIRREHMPGQRLILTVSPQPLTASFRAISPVVADAAGKAILRAGVDDFLRSHEDELNRTYFYFPAYEIVTRLIVDPFYDHAHLHPQYARMILDIFARHFTTADVPNETAELLGDTEQQLTQVIASQREKIELLERASVEWREQIDTLAPMAQAALPYLRLRRSLGLLALPVLRRLKLLRRRG